LAGSKSGLAALQDFDPAYDRTGSKPEKLNESRCFPLFTQQRTSPRSGEEPDVKEAQRLMSIAEYWAKLADIEDGQRESTVGETTGG